MWSYMIIQTKNTTTGKSATTTAATIYAITTIFKPKVAGHDHPSPPPKIHRKPALRLRPVTQRQKSCEPV